MRRKTREGCTCDLRELTPELIAEMIHEVNAIAGKKDPDSKLYYPDAFTAKDYKNWIKKVRNYLHSRTGKAVVPRSYVIRAADVDPDEAPNEYTPPCSLWAVFFHSPQYKQDNREVYVDPDEALDEYTCSRWAASFHTPQYKQDNREVSHLFKDLFTKTEGATWFEKVKDGGGRAAHLLLWEHYVGKGHDMRRAASANAKLELLFWKNEASFAFDEFLTRMNKAFTMELEDPGQPLFPQQKVQWLLGGVKNDDTQVQTTIGIIRD